VCRMSDESTLMNAYIVLFSEIVDSSSETTTLGGI